MTEISTFYTDHPHPVLSISSERIITAANPAAGRFFGRCLLEGAKCHEVFFGNPRPCKDCVLVQLREDRYHSRTVSGLLADASGPSAEYFVTAFAYQDTSGAMGCHKTIHPIPHLLALLRSQRSLDRRIKSADSVEKVITAFCEFLTDPPYLSPYRVRRYDVDDHADPQVLTCRWHDQNVEQGRPYTGNLVGTKLSVSEPGERASFLAFTKNSPVLVTPSEDDLEMFVRNFAADTESTDRTLMVSSDDIFGGLRLRLLISDDTPISVFADDDPHSWLDIPFGQPGNWEGKISITPQGRRTQLTREEMEVFAFLMSVANGRILAINLRGVERKDLMLRSVHEMAQPAFLALTSTEFLRRKDLQNNVTAKTDRIGYYVKKNIETAIRLVAFLNDSYRVDREKPFYDPNGVRLLSGVIAPIVNLIRHYEYMEALNRREMTLSAEHLEDVTLGTSSQQASGSHSVHFKFGSNCSISYDDSLATVLLLVNTYTLQEIFYNLLNNASKYRADQYELKIEIRHRNGLYLRESDPTCLKWDAAELHDPFHVVDVLDHGCGFSDEELGVVFALGVAGSAAQSKPGAYGSGRGLFVVREIMLGMGGEVFVLSPRQPTAIRLLFPSSCGIRGWINRIQENRDAISRLMEGIGLFRPELD